MKVYTCWITCMLESYQDSIVAALIKKKYTVGLASSGTVVLNEDDQVSAILAYTIYKISDENIDISKVYDDVILTLREIKGYYYSVIVAESQQSTWTGSNMIVKSNKDVPQLPPPPGKKSNLN